MDDNFQQQLAKAKPFFDRAEQVEATDNFDYAVDMYIEGLRRAPDAIDDGHIPLRHMSFIRQGKGGKKPSMVDKMKHRGGKTALERLLNAEYLLAKDPDSLEYIQLMVKAAVAGKFVKIAEWIADLFFDAAKASKKDNIAPFLLLKDAYGELELYDKAVQACSYAVKLKPDDGALADELKFLSANMAMRRGKYDGEGDFRRMMKDRDKQEKLQAQDAVVKTEDYKVAAVREARQEFKENPEKAENYKKLASVLADLGTAECFKEAEKILSQGYEKFKDFSLKRLQGEIEIKYLRIQARRAKSKIESNPDDDKARKQFRAIANRLIQVEIDHYKACVENYPTDLKIKYEYGSRLLQAKKYDEAIPVLQDAQRNPKNKVAAMDKLGICFFNKGWYTDSIDIFNNAIKSHELEDDAIGKDLRYNLARAYEREGKASDALALYRKLAQIDFGYKDVRTRVDKLRNGNNSDS